MITIRDVARHADVSVATVSRVINKKDFVSDDLTQRVQHSISFLGFEPDFLARTWRTRVTRAVAAVISDNTSPHHGIVIREAGAVAMSRDYSLVLCTTFSNADTERRYLRMLRLRRIDGVLLNTVGDCEDGIRDLTAAGVPVVLLNRPLGSYGPLVDAVVVDSYRGSYNLVDHLIRLGHRRIALLTGWLHTYHRSERLRGYYDALQAHDLPVDASLARSCEPGYGNVADLITDLTRLSPRPTALYAGGYSIGLAAMTALRAQGRHIPQDIAFAMFDDVPWGAFMDPPLTLVRNPGEEIGRAAMELLFARMADRTRPPQEVRLQPEMVVRRSCGWQGEIVTPLAVAMRIEAALPVAC